MGMFGLADSQRSVVEVGSQMVAHCRVQVTFLDRSAHRKLRLHALINRSA